MSNFQVTGISSSRLSELRKYTITDVFNNQYFGNGSDINNGVDFNESIQNEKVVYYIDGIKYSDYISTTGTTTKFKFLSDYDSEITFENALMFKNPNKSKLISNPKINDDVFIIRQEASVFDWNYRLEYIKSLVDLNTYAGGNLFNIVNNS